MLDIPCRLRYRVRMGVFWIRLLIAALAVALVAAAVFAVFHGGDDGDDDWWILGG